MNDGPYTLLYNGRFFHLLITNRKSHMVFDGTDIDDLE